MFSVENIGDLTLYPILKERIPWLKVQWKLGRYLPRMVQRMSIPTLLELVPETIELISYIQLLGYTKIHNCWMNLYRDGNDYTPNHRDSYGTTVITFSFGTTRKFIIKNKLGLETTYLLKNGDICIFDDKFDKDHTHSVPKESNRTLTPINGDLGRISLVFFVE